MIRIECGAMIPFWVEGDEPVREQDFLAFNGHFRQLGQFNHVAVDPLSVWLRRRQLPFDFFIFHDAALFGVDEKDAAVPV